MKITRGMHNNEAFLIVHKDEDLAISNDCYLADEQFLYSKYHKKMLVEMWNQRLGA